LLTRSSNKVVKTEHTP